MHGKKNKDSQDEPVRLEDLVSDRWVSYGDALWVLQMRDTLATVRKLDDNGKFGWDVVDGPRYVASGIADSVFEAQMIAEKCMPGWVSAATPEQISRARLDEAVGFQAKPEFYAVPESIKKARTAGSGCAYLYVILGVVALVAPASIQAMPLGVYQIIYVIMCGFLLMAGGYEWYRAKVLSAYAMGEKTAGRIFKMTTVLGTACGVVACGLGMFLLKIGQDTIKTAGAELQASVQLSIYLSLFLVACTAFTLAMVVISRLISHNAMHELWERRELEKERMAAPDPASPNVEEINRAVAQKAKAEAAASAAEAAALSAASKMAAPAPVVAGDATDVAAEAPDGDTTADD